MNATRLPVLMYHRVGPPHARESSGKSVATERFSAQLRLLASAGYRGISAADALDWLLGHRTMPEGSVLVTFDDGYADLVDCAAPTLAALKWPAAVFLVTGKLGGTSDWSTPAHQLLDPAAIQALGRSGFSFHAHSHTHPDLSTLPAHALQHELQVCRAALDELELDSRLLAYPYGQHSPAVVEAARQAGYSAAFTTRSGFNQQGDDPFLLRRLDVFGTDSPAALLHKVALGTNDGSRRARARYLTQRLAVRLGHRQP